MPARLDAAALTILWAAEAWGQPTHPGRPQHEVMAQELERLEKPLARLQ